MDSWLPLQQIQEHLFAAAVKRKLKKKREREANKESVKKQLPVWASICLMYLLCAQQTDNGIR